MDLKNYKKCKYCNADMSFNPATGRLICRHCGRAEWIHTKNYKTDMNPIKEVSIEDIKNKTKQREVFLEKRKIICKNCNGEVEYNATDNALLCPFCGSQLITEKEDSDERRPDGVIPFKVKEEQARAAFNKWINNSLYYPLSIKTPAKKAKIKGVYIPVWTYDAPAYVKCRGSYCKKQGLKKIKINFDETITLKVDDMISVATDKYDLSRIKEIEPFSTERNIPYRPEYMVGFESELQTVHVQTGWDKESVIAEDGLRRKAIKEIKTHFYGYKDITVDDTKVKYGDITCKHLFIPIWICEFAYKGNDYYYLVNGETGKVTGEVPYSYKKLYAIAFALLTGMIWLIKYAKTFLIVLGGIVALVLLVLWIAWIII
ncbi:MAG: hypothetical protein IKN54_02095, partial [Lachnospiraceae bacterium]|nr:hypothetical protein [Lachnospiraceae bacterium]